MMSDGKMLRVTILSAAVGALVATIAALSINSPPSRAAQDDLYSPTAGTVSGLQLTNNYNAALAALASCNSGSSAPANLSGGPVAGQCWLDTTSAPYAAKVYDGASWVVKGYLDTTNHLWLPQVGGGTTTLASATATDLCSVPQSYIDVTGTTTITGFGSSCAAGVEKVVKFSGVLTLTHNASTLILPSAANITTAAGDLARIVTVGSGAYRVFYARASGNAIINPSVEVGSVIFGVWGTTPAKYLLGQGQAISRATYPDYVTAATSIQSVGHTSGSPTLTGFSDITRFGAGMPIEGANIPAGTTIVSCAGSNCTISQNATATTTANVQVFLTGYGIGGDSTTIGVFNCAGRVIAGRDPNAGNLDNATAVASVQGSKDHTLTVDEMPAHTHVQNPHGHEFYYGSTSANTGGTVRVDAIQKTNPGSYTQVLTSDTTAVNQSTGGGAAHPIVQPTIIGDCAVRVQL